MACFLLVWVASLAGAEVRIWSLPDGRQVRAEITGIANGDVILKVENSAAPVRIPVSKLSPADRAAAANWKPEGTRPEPPSPPAAPGKWPQGTNSTVERDAHGWPLVVTLKAWPAITVFEENKDAGRFVYRSDHFEFVANERLTANIVKQFSKLFETTFEAVAALPIGIRPQPPAGGFKVLLFTTREAYFRAGGPPGSGGVFKGGSGDVMVPLPNLGVKKIGERWVIEDREGNDTLIHEVTHQVMGPWLRMLPVWLVEGSAEYMTAARYGSSSGRLTLRGYGHNMEEYLRDSKGVRSREIPLRDLQELMTVDHASWNRDVATKGGFKNYYSAMLVFFYFCHKDGEGTGRHLIDYFHARATSRAPRDDAAERTRLLLRDRSYEALAKEIEKALSSVGIRANWPEAKD